MNTAPRGVPSSALARSAMLPRRDATLMRRLGYKKFVAQGGDWGNAISEVMALQAPPELLGISTNMPAAVPVDISKAIFQSCDVFFYTVGNMVGQNGPVAYNTVDEFRAAVAKDADFLIVEEHVHAPAGLI